jgi:hypothetical protein
MLGRKTYTQQEFDGARAAIDEQLAAYAQLVEAIGGPSPDSAASMALDAFEPLFFKNMTLVLDRYFVHRLRTVTGTEGNALNEVELITDSLLNNDGVLREQGDQIHLRPVGLEARDRRSDQAQRGAVPTPLEGVLH